MRVRKTHDLHHIVTGFSMIGPGELGVIAITALHYGYPAFMTLDLGAIALGMLRVEGWGNQVRYVSRGWEMAERIKPLMGVRWEEGLDRPLEVWRRELNVEPIREGQNSWYTVLSDLAL
jgi:ubiquinone biosynthesis protein COQ4